MDPIRSVIWTRVEIRFGHDLWCDVNGFVNQIVGELIGLCVCHIATKEKIVGIHCSPFAMLMRDFHTFKSLLQ